MTASTANPKVDFYFKKDGKWQDEVKELRRIALSTGLAEELKWGHPCYTLDGANVVLIHDFNDYCALLFHKGVLLEDPAGILVQQTENVQSARQLRFTSVAEILEKEPVIKDYIQRAVEAEKAGLEVEFKDTSEFPMPIELQNKFDEDPAFKEAFEALTPGRQRGYLLHFSGAKQSKTRESRIEKVIPQIFEGIGYNER